MKIEIIEKTKNVWKFSGSRTRTYKTAKREDVVKFLESKEHQEWLAKNGSKPNLVNKEFTNSQIHDLFLNANFTIEGCLDSMPFKNFKKAFGRQITWIQEIKCFKCGKQYRGVKERYSHCPECIKWIERDRDDTNNTNY